eukprot:8405569-Pyramimonas_sp.AAC.1
MSVDANCEMGDRLVDDGLHAIGIFSQGARGDRGQLLIEKLLSHRLAAIDTFDPLAKGSTCHSWSFPDGP